MRKQTVFSLVLLALAILLVPALAFPQETKVAPAPERSVNSGEVMTWTQQSPQPAPGAYTWSFVDSEFTFEGKPVKGAPYSAQAITETSQTLSDGNRIVNTSTAMLYRDNEGRTRREQTLKAIGGLATGDQPLQIIMISDPVAGLTYTLDPAAHTARKGGGVLSITRSGQGGDVGYAIAGGGNFNTAVRGPEPGPPAKAVPPSVFSTSGGIPAAPVRVPGGKSDNVNVEPLGTQLMEGVEATGVRTTFTIPAGQIGNERPIDSVDERWISKELQLV